MSQIHQRRFQNFSRLQKFLLIFCSLLAGIFVFEVSARLFHIDFNLNPNWRYHPVLGWSQVPDFRESYSVNGNVVHVEFNSKGFRDVDHPVQKPAGTRRIVVIGDSICEAVQVNLEQTFFKRLENKLNQIDKNRWEVINLGIGDFGTAQEWIALEKYGFSYSPDLIICEIFPLNDICNNTMDLYNLCNSNNDPYRPYFILKADGLVLTTAQPVRNFLRRYSIAYGVLERSWLMLRKSRQRGKEDEIRERRLGEQGFPVLDPLLYTYANDSQQLKSISKGWRITEMILQRIALECRKRQIPLIAVVVPFEACVGEKSWRAFTAATPRPKLIQNYPETRLDRFFKNQGVPAVMLKDHFEKDVQSVLPYIDGHLNPAGHRIMADAIFSKMLEERLIQVNR